MSDLKDFAQVSGDIAVIASMITRQRRLADQMRARGQDCRAIDLALEDLADLYRQRLEAREVANSP